MRIYTGLNVHSDFGGRFPWKSKFIDHNGIKQAYVDEGPRGAPVTFVCLHGNPTWGFLYRDFIRRLSVHQRVIAVDHVGFGRSDKPHDPTYYTIARHVSNLDRLLAEVGAENMVPIIHDWGGPIGMGWATRHPETVAGIVVLNTTAFVWYPVPNIPSFQFPIKLLTGGWRHAIDHNFFVEFFMGSMGTARRMTNEDLEPYRAPFPYPEDRMGIARMPNVWDGGNPGYEAYAGAGQTDDALAKLADKPALICWALKDRAFRKPYLARWQRLLRRVDGPHLLPHASHFLQEDAPLEIIDQIERWLTEQVLTRLEPGEERGAHRPDPRPSARDPVS